MPSLMRRLLLLLVLATAARADVLDQVVANVDRRYNRLDSLTADFVEVYKGAGMSRSESGTLWLKRPGRMRWDYRQPREKLFVTDGKTAWFYVTGDRQARRASVRHLDDMRTPLRYLLGKTQLRKEFDGLEVAQVAPLTPGNIVLRGVPRHLADRVTSTLLEVSIDGQIHRIVVEEVDGSTTEFRFSNQRENPALLEREFRFQPPAGIEVIEAKELSP